MIGWLVKHSWPLTCLDTFSQVFFSLKIELLMKAEVISSTELKLWRLRQTSATAAHFSITVARAEGDWCFTISDATRELVCKKEEQGYKYIGTQLNLPLDDTYLIKSFCHAKNVWGSNVFIWLHPGKVKKFTETTIQWFDQTALKRANKGEISSFTDLTYCEGILENMRCSTNVSCSASWVAEILSNVAKSSCFVFCVVPRQEMDN